MPLAVSNCVDQRAAVARADRVRRRRDVDVEYARAVAIEFDVDLRRRAADRARHVRRSRRAFSSREHFRGVRLGLVVERLHEIVDRLLSCRRRYRWPESKRRSRSRRDLGRHIVRNACAQYSVDCLRFEIEKHVDLSVRSHVQRAAERLLRRAGRYRSRLATSGCRARSRRSSF